MSVSTATPALTDTPYAWLLFGDLSTGNTGARVWQSGPDGKNSSVSMHDLLGRGVSFRLVNADGIAMYEGYIIGEYAGDEPLNEYGREHGCVAIEYDNTSATL